MDASRAPLAGLDVVVHASGVAATYAGRLLGVLGAEVTLIEASSGAPLRRRSPFLPSGASALFAYLAAGARSEIADPSTALGRERLRRRLRDADVFITDVVVAERGPKGLDPAAVLADCPSLVYVSVLPFGAEGPKAHWKGEDINVQHASGEGYLLPNGLTCELFPDRPPVKIHGHFAGLQGGIAAALGALSAIWARPAEGGQYVDVSSQDATLAVASFAIQRLGDGSVEHRVERSFRYGGVIPCADGHVELLTLEQRQWDGLVKLLGDPDWARDPALADPLERSRRGEEINGHIRAWARDRKVRDIVRDGQALSVPLAKYYTPAEVVADPHEQVRGLFQTVDVPGEGALDMLVSPFHFDGKPLSLRDGPPTIGGAMVGERARA